MVAFNYPSVAMVTMKSCLVGLAVPGYCKNYHWGPSITVEETCKSSIHLNVYEVVLNSFTEEIVMDTP